MRFTRHLAIVWAVLLGLGCSIVHGQPDARDEGMPPRPPARMNGMGPGKGFGGPNNMGPQKGFHRGDEFRNIWEKFQKEKPEEAARLENLKRTNREEYFRELRKLFPMKVRVPNMTMKLDQKCWELGRQYKIARTEEERKAIRKELEEMVEKSFEAMVQESRDRLEALQKKLQDMEMNKEKINKQRLEMFMRGFWKAPRPDEDGDDGPKGGMLPPPPPQMPEPPAPPQEDVPEK